MTASGGPASVIRGITVEMANRLQEEATSSSQDSRYMLSGPAGSGKSVLMLQTIVQALSAGWIVLYVPKCECGRSPITKPGADI